MFDFQYVTYKTKLKTNKYCLIALIIHHWKVYFIKRGEGAVFDRHKKSICSKRRSYQYLLGDCVYGCNFLLRNGTFLDLKTKHIVC